MPKPHTREWYEGRIQLLQYLDGVALKTEGGGVWRALFGECWRVHKLELAALLNPKPGFDVRESLGLKALSKEVREAEK